VQQAIPMASPTMFITENSLLFQIFRQAILK